MIVIDTHVLIWFIEGDSRLGDKAAERIERSAIEETIWIPAICAWEIAFIETRDALPFAGGSRAWMQKTLSFTGFRPAPLDPAIAIDSVTLEWSHKDPTDRMIVATARHFRTHC